MPSPAFPRPSSEPFLSCSASASATAAVRARLPPPNRSTCSSRSSKSSYWLAWSNINQLGTFILSGRNSADSSSRHSDLTEGSLEAHNRRQEAIVLSNADGKKAKCSPYYKGLTDATLIINRERHQYLPPSTSPGRESHATTVTTSNSLSSTIIFKMQEYWGSCFLFSYKSSQKEKDSNFPAASASVPIALTDLDSSASSSPSRMPLERKNARSNPLSAVQEEKPLREIVLTTKAPTSVTTDINDDNKKETLMVGTDFNWANKYQPKALKDFICNRDQAIRMQGLMRDVDCNHLIFEGPPGVGKRTMIWAMLQEALGPDDIIQIREESKAFDLKGEQIGSIKVRVKVSSPHVEVNLLDLKGYEKHVIVELIKETHNKRSNKALHSKLDNCRAIILYEAEKLSTDALLYIKWLLERYEGFSKFFFCCGDVSKLQPIRNLCTVVQLFPPSRAEIVEVLEFIAKQEGIELPNRMAEKFADNSKNNLRQAIRSFEATWRHSHPLANGQEILTGWEDDIANIARNIIQEQSPKQLYIIRGKLQNLIEYDVSPDFIFETMVRELKKHLDESFQLQVDSLYKDYNGNDGNILESESQLVILRSRHEEDSNKSLSDYAKTKVQHFMRIEEFIAKFMSFYKLSVSANKGLQHNRETSADLSLGT